MAAVELADAREHHLIELLKTRGFENLQVCDAAIFRDNAGKAGGGAVSENVMMPRKAGAHDTALQHVAPILPGGAQHAVTPVIPLDALLVRLGGRLGFAATFKNQSFMGLFV